MLLQPDESCGVGRALHGYHSPVRHLYLSVESKLHDQVERAAAGVKTPSWLRHMVHQVTITDFPASWQAEQPAERSHDSRADDTRFMLRLDESSRTKLQHLVAQLHASRAAIIRHLITQAKPTDFPKSWHKRAAERRAQQSDSQGTDADGGSKP